MQLGAGPGKRLMACWWLLVDPRFMQVPGGQIGFGSRLVQVPGGQIGFGSRLVQVPGGQIEFRALLVQVFEEWSSAKQLATAGRDELLGAN